MTVLLSDIQPSIIDAGSLKSRCFIRRIDYTSSHFLCSLEVTDLLLTALENPIKCAEDNAEQKVNTPVRLGAHEKEELSCRETAREKYKTVC